MQLLLSSTRFVRTAPRFHRLAAAATTNRWMWSTGQVPTPATHALHALTPAEITQASSLVKMHLKLDEIRFVAVSLQEPPKSEHDTFGCRMAEIVVLNPKTGIATELTVTLDDVKGHSISRQVDLPRGVQPMFTPDDCALAEGIIQQSAEVK